MNDNFEQTGVKINDAEGEVTALKRQCDEYLAGWKRAQADYANLKRETKRDLEELAKYSAERTVYALLPVIDQFETALRHVPPLENLSEDKRRIFETWIEGLEAVRSVWEAAARDLGLERVPTKGELDPAVHEAVAEEIAPSVPSGGIVRAAQSGWKLNGKLLRPAKVIVSKVLQDINQS